MVSESIIIESMVSF